MKVTIKDVAERSGVSKTAVSFAFNSPGKISRVTYERIMAVSEELGYAPDPVARTLATRQTSIIGFLVPQSIPEVFQNPYVSEILRGIGAVCHEKNLSLVVLPPIKGFLSQTVRNAVVDGVITLGIGSNNQVHKIFQQRLLPYVTIDAGSSAEYINVGIDDEEAAENLVNYLLDKGHRRIAFCTLKLISHDLSDYCRSMITGSRLQGIRSALTKRGLSMDDTSMFQFYETESSLRYSYNLAMKILSGPERPTAVFCMADVQAYGFYQAARELKLSIPRAVSITGFDDTPFSALLEPTLTTVHQPGYEKGYTAAQLLTKLLAGMSCSSVSLPFELIVRNSVSSI